MVRKLAPLLAPPDKAGEGVDAFVSAPKRRVTIYMPPDLFKRMALHCAEHDVDYSEFLTRAAQRSLSDEPGGAKATGRARG